jgi:hypothetical protein
MRTASVLAVSLAALAAHADVTWDEFADGDLSTDPNTPTPLTFGLGGNIIIGSVHSPADSRDYITFTIPQGMALASLYQHQWQDLDTGGAGDTGFHALNEGSTSFIPGEDTIAFFLGAAHMIQVPHGTDLLPELAVTDFGNIGFSIPLGPGTYSYLVQQTGVENTGYALEFVVTPAPGAAALFGLTTIGAARRRRR